MGHSHKLCLALMTKALAYKIISYLVLMLFSRYLGASAFEKVVFFFNKNPNK